MIKIDDMYKTYFTGMKLYEEYLASVEKYGFDVLKKTIDKIEEDYGHCFSDVNNLEDVVEAFGQKNFDLLEELDGYRFKIFDTVEDSEEKIFEIYNFLEDSLDVIKVTYAEDLIGIASLLVTMSEYMEPELAGFMCVRSANSLTRNDFNKMLKRISNKSLDTVILLTLLKFSRKEVNNSEATF